MLERLNEKLNITEGQKKELVGLLFSYMKLMRQSEKFRSLTPEELTSYWIKYVKKPKWMEGKIANDINFIARVHEFIEVYLDGLEDKEIDKVDVDVKGSLNSDVVEFLRSLCDTKEIDMRNVRWFDRSELMGEIDRIFYVNYPPKDESKIISKLLGYII